MSTTYTSLITLRNIAGRRSTVVERMALVANRSNTHGSPHRRTLHSPQTTRRPPSSSVRACNVQTSLSCRPQSILVSRHRLHHPTIASAHPSTAKSTFAANSGYVSFVFNATHSLLTTKIFRIPTSQLSSSPNTPPSSTPSRAPPRFPPSLSS